MSKKRTKGQTYCIIMAGGVGSRFWPLSKTSRPKQFIDILGTGETLIQQTFRRLRNICDTNNFYIVTSYLYIDLVKRQLPEISDDQILSEPLRRNTAPCIAYACNKIKVSDPDANIVVAPSDHLITKEDEFHRQLLNGIAFASDNEALLTLGITPSRPETGYGYIQVNGKVVYDGVENLHKVKTFTEKPDIKMAKVFIDSGEFFWNSGIFIWSVKAILNAFDKYLPDIGDLFKKGVKLYNTEDEKAFLNKTYPECRNISIDYGIMEKAGNVYVLCSDFGWSDLGTWSSLWENSEKDENGNALKGKNVMVYETDNTVVNIENDKLVVIQGLEDYIVVESDNTLLVCRRENEQQIRKFVNDVRISMGDEYV